MPLITGERRLWYRFPLRRFCLPMTKVMTDKYKRDNLCQVKGLCNSEEYNLQLYLTKNNVVKIVDIFVKVFHLPGRHNFC